MKKNFKNLMALVLTGAMLTAGTSVFADYTGGTASGTGGTLSGTGGAVEIKNAQKINVIVPTKIDMLNFVLDPAGAMSMVEDGDVEIEKGSSVYFASEYEDPYAATLKPTKYGSTSAPLFFRNKGIMPVNIQVTVKGAGSGHNITVKEAKDFDGKANLALSAGAVNKDGKTLADLTPVDATNGAVVNSIIDDSRDCWEITASGFTLTYSTGAEETDFAQTGIVVKGEADVAFDWEAGMNDSSNKVDPSKFELQTIYNLSTPESKVIKLADIADGAKGTELTVNGVKKSASKNPGTDTLTIRFIDTKENKSTSKDVKIADLGGAVTVSNDNKLTVTKEGWQGLYEMAGNDGVATMMISAPGAQGIVVTVR